MKLLKKILKITLLIIFSPLIGMLYVLGCLFIKDDPKSYRLDF